MTIDIEKERREFEAEFTPRSADGKYWMRKSANGDYRNAAMQGLWQGWLAAKRADIGNVEPVEMADAPKHIYLVMEDGGDAYTSFADAKQAADKGEGITWCEDRQSVSDIPYVRADLSAPPSTDAKDAFLNSLPKPIYRNQHVGGTVGYLATEHYNEGWNDCLEAVRAITAKEPKK